ncbi:MAG TPA: DUF3617 family protein [Thermoanaerobaculia bacterium]|nr:DUF3617 family protein [Thermoanaerobaculia bacterium]
MRLRNALGVFIAVIGVAGTVAGAQQPASAVMAPGLWEITIQTRAPIVGVPLTHTVCIAKALVSRPDPPRSKPSDDCQVQPDAAAANETAYTVRCAQRATTSSWRFTYAGDHFDGTSTLTSGQGEVRQTFTGKRIGACDDVPPAP